MLQLDLIKIYILPRICSQHCKIEIVNFKKYDEQLNLTWSSIKDKLFKITKECKEFKFEQNLQVEFTKNDEVFKGKVFIDPWFDSETIEFNDINIDQLHDIQHNQLLSRVERWMYEGSGWTIHSILQHHLVNSEIAPC